MLVSETPFVVVDVETTGLKAQQDRIIELAAVKVQDGKITDRFVQLVNPERSVPRRITRMTGLTTAGLFEEPTIAEVMPEFMQFLGEGVFVAHNVTFDQRFVNAELERLGQPEFSNETLCTLRLARRLLGGLPSKGLAPVADFYDISIEGRHRALGDAEAAARVLLRFLRKLDFEHDIEELEELLTFQYQSYSRSQHTAKHVARIRGEVLDTLPERPGVYFMKDEMGVMLYIGKAKSLKARVSSYFSGLASKPSHTRKLVQTLRRLEWEETPSELHALLRESQLIKEHKPHFNRAQRRYRNRPFLRLATSEAFPRLSSTAYIRNDGAAYFGPLSSRRTAEFVVELVNRSFKLRECSDEAFAEGRRCLYAQMGRCNAPCQGGDGASCYDVEVQRVRDFLAGRDDTLLHYLEGKMHAAAEQFNFEEAGTYRDQLKKLKRLTARQQCIAASVLNHHAVVLKPARGKEAVQLFFVRFGRLAGMYLIPAPARKKERGSLRERLQQHFGKEEPPPERYYKEEVEDVRLLAHWLYTHREEVVQLPCSSESDPDGLMDRVLAEVEKMA